ncbi:hypothetical protein KP509_25G026500 [Ceratopteris richardii]|uniref:Uncharacterized protein n=1 Tax=Ceratopteris richardii TaxID=49495 RepID=A0A8T2RRA9_CERRI|nr:hypothetical protein KP509_25G026500 [Ceratopteris richardii]
MVAISGCFYHYADHQAHISMKSIDSSEFFVCSSFTKALHTVLHLGLLSIFLFPPVILFSRQESD